MDISELKNMAAQESAKFIKSGGIVGIGTGTTVLFVIEHLKTMVGQGLNITTVASSIKTERLLKEAGIKVAEFEAQKIELYIDGADEIDRQLNMIKGGGGALLREKVLAYNSKFRVIVVDETKLKDQLGAYPIPVEVVPFAHKSVANHFKTLGFEPKLRLNKNGTIFVTDNGNYIIDCKLGMLGNLENIEKKMRSIPGVVETGIFINLGDLAIIGTQTGIKKISKGV